MTCHSYHACKYFNWFEKKNTRYIGDRKIKSLIKVVFQFLVIECLCSSLMLAAMHDDEFSLSVLKSIIRIHWNRMNFYWDKLTGNIDLKRHLVTRNKPYEITIIKKNYKSVFSIKQIPFVQNVIHKNVAFVYHKSIATQSKFFLSSFHLLIDFLSIQFLRKNMPMKIFDEIFLSFHIFFLFSSFRWLSTNVNLVWWKKPTNYLYYVTVK